MDITLPSNVTSHCFCCTSSRTTKLNPTNLTQIAVLMFTFVFLRCINTVPQKLSLKEQRTNIKMRTKKNVFFFSKPTFIECNSKDVFSDIRWKLRLLAHCTMKRYEPEQNKQILMNRILMSKLYNAHFSCFLAVLVPLELSQKFYVIYMAHDSVVPQQHKSKKLFPVTY